MLSQLQAQPTLILKVIQYEHRLNSPVEQFKAKAELIDGSFLHINEVWIAGQLEKYAYYRLTPTGTVIQGWDNAPHHPEIDTHPHHSHTPKGIIVSQVRTLTDVLSILSQQLNK